MSFITLMLTFSPINENIYRKNGNKMRRSSYKYKIRTTNPWIITFISILKLTKYGVDDIN